MGSSLVWHCAVARCGIDSTKYLKTSWDVLSHAISAAVYRILIFVDAVYFATPSHKCFILVMSYEHHILCGNFLECSSNNSRQYAMLHYPAGINHWTPWMGVNSHEAAQRSVTCLSRPMNAINTSWTSLWNFHQPTQSLVETLGIMASWVLEPRPNPTINLKQLEPWLLGPWYTFVVIQGSVIHTWWGAVCSVVMLTGAP